MTEQRAGPVRPGLTRGRLHALPHQHHSRRSSRLPASEAPARDHRGEVPFFGTGTGTSRAVAPGPPAAARRCRHRPLQLAARIRRTKPMPTRHRPSSGPFRAPLAPSAADRTAAATVGRR
ncbi:hypothetical protein KPATCC21470_7214 [Kitasatospora purpeofusca]